MVKIVFFGTPNIAASYLESLHLNKNVKLVGVVTMPDKPAKRGYKLTPPPVKVYAEKNNIPYIQPAKIDANALEWVKNLMWI